MYSISEEQIDFILNDIKNRGIELEDLQQSLLDHMCCIIENECNSDDDFSASYEKILPRFFNKELKEIQEETTLLLTFKNYYAMKKSMMISGTAAVILLCTGSIFKLMHWPGAGPMLVLGIAFLSLVFLPLLFILKSKETQNATQKLTIGLGALVGILYCLSTLFKVMHWPGASILWFLTIGISALLFIPIFFFTGIRNPDTKVNTMVTTILLVGATSILFMLMNLRPPKKELQLKMYNYLKSEEVLSELKNKRSNDTASASNTIQLAQEIDAKCEQIKELILTGALGEAHIPIDFESKQLLLEDGSVGNAFYEENSQGQKLLAELKEDLNKYNQVAMTKIPMEHTVLDADFGKIANYNVFSVLNNISGLQLYLACSKN